MSNEQNPYLPPTTVPARPTIKNTLPRLIGVALYPIATLTALSSVGMVVAVISLFVRFGTDAFETVWREPTPLVVGAVSFCITAGLIWLARFLRRDRSTKAKVLLPDMPN